MEKNSIAFAHISGFQLSEEGNGVGQRLRILPFAMRFPEVVHDDSSLLPFEQVRQGLSCRGNDSLSDRVCRLTACRSGKEAHDCERIEAFELKCSRNLNTDGFLQ